MSFIENEFVREFIRMCEDGFRAGWHEHSGGNLSYRLKPEDIRLIKDELKPEQDRRDIGRDIPGLGDEYFLVTGKGKHFRDIAHKPESNIGIIKLDEDGEDYNLLYGHESFMPTGEIITHLVGHDVKKHTQNHRVIYHCHPANIAALSMVLPHKSKIFTRAFWRTLTETAVVLPNGVEVLEWMVPCKPQAAEAIGAALKKTDAVILPHHGLFTSGTDFAEAFGLAQTVEKAAEITLKALSVPNKKKRGINRGDLKKLSAAFDLELDLGTFDSTDD